jgi:hypothetical protein
MSFCAKSNCTDPLIEEIVSIRIFGLVSGYERLIYLSYLQNLSAHSSGRIQQHQARITGPRITLAKLSLCQT